MLVPLSSAAAVSIAPLCVAQGASHSPRAGKWPPNRFALPSRMDGSPARNRAAHSPAPHRTRVPLLHAAPLLQRRLAAAHAAADPHIDMPKNEKASFAMRK